MCLFICLFIYMYLYMYIPRARLPAVKPRRRDYVGCEERPARSSSQEARRDAARGVRASASLAGPVSRRSPATSWLSGVGVQGTASIARGVRVIIMCDVTWC